MAHRILVASYTNDVVTLSFDPDTKTLSVVSSITLGHHPSWITAHPDDHSLVFTGLEQSEGKVIALRYDAEGKGKVVSEISSAGSDPCTLLVTNDELFVGNYSSANVAIFPVSKDSLDVLPNPPSTFTLVGSGPNVQRQESPHPHQVFFLEQYGELLVPDLGSDHVNRYVKGVDGKWNIHGHIKYPGGSGPRHVAFYDGYLYTLLELTSAVAKHRLPPLPSLPNLVKVVPTMSNPAPFPNDMLAAEILCPTPNSTFTTPYLYVSNRNDPSPEGDILSIFSISNPSSVELVTEVRTGLKHVRGILFGGPDDKYLVAGGALGGGVKVYERVDGGKGFQLIAANADIEAPTAFLWI